MKKKKNKLENDAQDLEDLSNSHSPALPFNTSKSSSDLLKDYMAEAVGGFFDAIGYLQAQLLIMWGLKKTDTLIDVGCGSGRLASQIFSYLDKGNYIGLNVVEELYIYAKNLCPRNNFKF